MPNEKEKEEVEGEEKKILLYKRATYVWHFQIFMTKVVINLFFSCEQF
jgi:hypothetical protein